MKVVHLFNATKPGAVQPKKPTVKEKRIARARRWQELQYARQYKEAVAGNWEEIQEIRKVRPNWMPAKAELPYK